MDCIKCSAPLPEGAVFCPACGKRQVSEPRRHRRRANGTGNISKLPGRRTKPWAARKNDILIGTFKTYSAASQALDKVADLDVNEKYNMTFQQVYDRWLPEHSRTIGSSAIGTYQSAYKNSTILHDKVFRKLRTSDFQQVIIDMEGKDLSKSSCEKVLQLFGQLSDWAIREGIMQTNYARFCTIGAQQKSKGNVFTSEDLKGIQSSNNAAADITLILLATGCRPNELFSVPLSNCADKYFIGGSKTDAGKNRVIAVAELGQAAYRKLKAEAAGKKCLIDGYKGNKTYANFAKREFKELMKEIGREGYTPYDCRHTFITMATKSGVDPQILRRMVGHADLATTDKYYTHLGLDDILGAIGSVDLTKSIRNKSATKNSKVKNLASKSS